ncbi:MAG TPA: hotdog domain-containing protein [Marmoricola sp.]|nr:hotdog domain-containing protein [Marmoricola sp.]
MTDPGLRPSQTRIVEDNLRYAVRHAASLTGAGPLVAAAAGLGDSDAAEPDPALPPVGATTTRDLVVKDSDTAAALGHPDEAVTVLASPRLGLWFELVCCDLLPAPGEGPTTVGSGILVHHLGKSEVGETVTLDATVAHTSGRHVVFDCLARTGDRVVGVGTHHRVLLR